MKKFVGVLSMLFLLIAAAFPAYAGIGNFYYKQNENKITVSLNSKIEWDINFQKNIIIACYDNDILIKTEIIVIDDCLNGIKMNDFTIELPKTPENLKVKVFHWTNFGNCFPLEDAKELSDVPEVASGTSSHCTAFKVKGIVTVTSREYYTDSDAIIFRILESENFNNNLITPDMAESYEMYIGNTDIDKHINELVEAYIVLDEDTDEYTVLKYKLVDGQKKTFEVSDIDLDSSTAQTIKTTGGDEYSVSEDIVCYLNGVEVYYSMAEVLEEIDRIDENYGKVKLVDTADIETLEGDGIYDFMFIESYTPVVLESISTEDEYGEPFDGIILNLEDGNTIPISEDEKYIEYNFVNEKMQECDMSKLYAYIGKTIYVSYDFEAGICNSEFYDIILEGADPKVYEPIPEDTGLTAANGNVLLRYSKTDKTALLEGELTMVSGGDEPYDINVDLMSGQECFARKTISTDCRISKIEFGKEVWSEFYSFGIPAEKRPDKAIISFDTANGDIADIEVPVVSAEAYKVYGRVLSLDKEAGTVEFRVEKSNNFEDETIYPWQNILTKTVKAGSTDAMEHIQEYALAYILKDDNGEYVMEYIRSLTPTFTAFTEDIDESKTTIGEFGKYLYIYPHGATRGSVKYALADDCQLIVDGEYIELTADDLWKYCKQCETITLFKANGIGSTAHSSRYAYIKINGYKEEQT